MNTIVLLGRYGDIVNLLPLAHLFGECKWVVGNDFADIFDGVSYVDPVVFPSNPDQIQSAVLWAKQMKYMDILPAQVHHNFDQNRMTSNFNLESWRLANHLLDYGSRPLVFDKRDYEREAALVRGLAWERVWKTGRPLVLVATKGVSAPFPKVDELLKKLNDLDANVVDIGDLKAERVYDLLGLLDYADCLVTVDTLHLHLAKAAYCPTVAIVRDGWLGPAVPSQAQWVHTYDTVKIDNVVRDVQYVLNKKTKAPSAVCMAVDMFESHIAQFTWPKIPVALLYPRSLLERDRSPLHYLKDILQEAMKYQQGSLIIWTNCDVGFTITGMERIRDHAQKWDFGCVRRDKDHIGRECFWFRREWLEEHIDEMPDVVLAAPKCDLVIAKWLRKFFGLPTSLESMKYDFAPVDLPPGIVYHDSSPSSWLDYQNSPSAVHNERLWNQ